MKTSQILALGFLFVGSVSASACRPRRSTASSLSLSSNSSFTSSIPSPSPSSPAASSLRSSSASSPTPLSDFYVSSKSSPIPSSMSSSSVSSLPSASSSLSVHPSISSASSHPSSAPHQPSSSPSSPLSRTPSSSSLSNPSLPSTPPNACISADAAPANDACTNHVTNPFFANEHATNLYGWTALNQGTGNGLQAYNCGGNSGSPGDVEFCSCVYLEITSSSDGSFGGVTQTLTLTPEMDYAFSVKYRTLPTNPADVYVWCLLQSTASPQPQMAIINLMYDVDVGSSTRLTPNEWLLWQTTFTPATAGWELECYMTASSPAVLYLVDVKIVPVACL